MIRRGERMGIINLIRLTKVLSRANMPKPRLPCKCACPPGIVPLGKN